MAARVIGVFSDWHRARGAVERLRDAGFSEEQISVFGAHSEEMGDIATPERPDDAGNADRTREGAITGAEVGGAAGALGGFLLGTGLLLIPGVGPLLAAGPLVGALSGLAAGASLGTIAGAFLAAGVSKDEAELYEREIRAGNVVIGITETAREGEAMAVLRDAGADSVLHPGVAGLGVQGNVPRDAAVGGPEPEVTEVDSHTGLVTDRPVYETAHGRESRSEIWVPPSVEDALRHDDTVEHDTGRVTRR